GYQVGQISGYTQRCCVHGPSKPALVSISQLPDFIVDDVNSAKIDEDHESAKIVEKHKSAKIVEGYESAENIEAFESEWT
ncbi:hypothetical protein BGX26_011844, partial [Mortierella sp. AD094]